VAPKFTDTTSSDLGLPKNPADPFGFTPNPAGFAFTDLGVGLVLRNLSEATPNSDWTPLAPAFDGFMQVSTARNADTRPKCPDCKTFPKAYMHNGYLKSLKEVVHFYNTRDVCSFDVESGHPKFHRQRI
jgi:cytochrome c peroxidase